jgi:hypothetical protein
MAADVQEIGYRDRGTPTEPPVREGTAIDRLAGAKGDLRRQQQLAYEFAALVDVPVAALK